MIAVRTFAEGATIYHQGEAYPREGIKPSGEHIKALVQDGLIREDEEKPKKTRKK